MVNNDSTHLDTLFAALSDRSRREILLMLLSKDMTVQDIAAPFETSLAAISKHLQILAKAGIISQNKIGREKWCRLNLDALGPASAWIESYGIVREEAYETLEVVIEQQAAILRSMQSESDA